MFERHFGLRENPFHSGHQLRFLYPSREHQEARAHLRFGIENREPFVLITGEVGTGKTTALYDALAEWGSKVSVALITNSALTRQELIEEIGLRFGLTVPAGASKPQALAMLERHLNGVRARGEHAVLLLDEAQNLAPELLEEIRLLSNLETQGERLVQIFLVGQPELEAVLAQPQLRQLRQRIGVHYRLNPLSPEETTAYIHHRIAVAGGNPFAAFPPETCLAVYRITHGIPREINTVASQAMIAAFSEGANTVVPEHVHAIQRESEFRSVLGSPANDVPDSPAAAVLREDRPAIVAPAIVAPPIIAAPAPTPAPPAAEPEPDASSEAANEPTHAWLPPELGEVPAAAAAPAPLAPERAPSETPAVAKEPEQVIDAWAAAAKDLMEAKRRGEVAAQDDRVEVVSHDAHAESAPARDVAPKFPSLAELTQRAASARPDNADLSGLPARLRAKIAADIAAEERRDTNKRRLVPIALGVMIVAALVTGTMLLQRFQVINVPVLRSLLGMPADSTLHSRTPAPAPVAAAPETTAVDTTQAATQATTPAPDNSAGALPPPQRGLDDASATTKPATTTAAANPATPTSAPATKPAVTSSAPTTTKPAVAPTPAKPVATTPAPTAKPAVTPAPAKPVATTPAATTTPAPKPTAPTSAPATKPATTATATTPAADGPVYGLGVAAYLDRDRAEEKRAELAAKGGLPATIVPFDDGGTTRYRIIVGHYASNAAAENAALGVMTKLGVSEARPLLLSRGKAR